MKLISRFLFITLLLFTAACSSDNDNSNYPDAKPIVLKTEFNNKLQNSGRFAIDLFNATYLHETKTNIFISPLSVDMALGMAWNGANGETANEMQVALRNEGYTPEQINEYAKTLREALLSVDPTTQLRIANSIWYKTGFSVEKSFIDVNRLNYNAEVNTLDFSSGDAVTRINNWCADNTNNKIPQIIESISDDMVMYLINAVYFKGIWRSKFDKSQTIDMDFTTENGTVQSVKMMRQESLFPYTEDLNARYLEMPYGNNAFSMVVILPQDGKTLDNVIHTLNNNSWNEAIDRLSARDIILNIPRFKAECEYKMEKKILPEMGMTLAFQAGMADFTKINPAGGLSISEVIHKTYINVDEEGSEAAAATSVGFEYTSVPSTTRFTVNEPFIFAIREKSTGAILFIGKIGEIE
ncbi:serine protease inhibitor [Dysgonomonas sp. PFB1-18]|uniref:serpin family protein n=1 Tax=unclassified Dysgonomonas TaxID=2630389 RepID=UPI0024731996|nr:MULTISPECIES: serpin family protein [unclassified Dysgonomonas]MDH6310234.1 serine protease inhibitor [Dysgonomonas sp. PF1-14]MDH6340053.1 serine protease inhibitor [Dysgonomonas sp. PF1-16]MDH6381840.1 serine protease inhibitor [Dysgonomonas sp. PFB1-18]MDH6398918.1 serine protease inhibitor [Dysgonomonas sp. PF1-23]